jgi:hypothetical protein
MGLHNKMFADAGRKHSGRLCSLKVLFDNDIRGKEAAFRIKNIAEIGLK